MSPLEILQLVGYSMAAALPLWMGARLFKRRHALSRIERVLLALSFGIGAWHASNLLLTLHRMLGLSDGRWTTLLRLTDTIAVVSITLTYSFLLHVHLHLWAQARARPLNITERVRVFLSYIPALFLSVAIPPLWRGAYAPMFEKVSYLLLPFALWASYVLCLCAVTDILISRISKTPDDRRLMRAVGVSFLSIAVLIILVHALGLGRGRAFGQYLETLSNVGSLLPTALLAYHIYRYRYLELIVKESLIVASFAGVVLVIYFYVIRAFGVWVTVRYDLRDGAVESLLILTLALLAAPFRRWLDKYFRRLFERETALYREIVTRIGAHAGRYQQLPDLLRFAEVRTVEGLGLRRVIVAARRNHEPASDNDGGYEGVGEDREGVNGFERRSTGVWEVGAGVEKPSGRMNEVAGSEIDEMRIEVGGSIEDARWFDEILESLRLNDWSPLDGEELLRARGFEMAYALRREEREAGLMLVDAQPEALTHDVRAVLSLLAGQLAIAIEDCRLVEENVRLERRVAQGERLAALGQMAATVAHEVKNPLSAIKSIAQVMREDERLDDEFSRDLELIVGETDRLNRSVTQMLSFARGAVHAGASQSVGEIVSATVGLLNAEAKNRHIHIESTIDPEEQTPNVAGIKLDGTRAAALRDALSNLLLNALQATPEGGRIRVGVGSELKDLVVSVADGGAGVPHAIRERIWHPFFTTRQRGTGLGLAIVRKRMEETGGSATLAPQRESEGARFELRLPALPNNALLSNN